ncbi:SusD/RagB family nutrient-binding outer membrane lipoprotein [Pedobacter nototheniae]|uniref:SusD/RagB family nutrient-binding outer membrane lipoprotein n=1 Tax=Pedobacter nototheniae TaxID=2488994 RepID=UPI00292DF1B2|nr:SusD/RagB family nutrient-binding outer membrane lipoprotein [Pedobacter nototheniae]
MNNQNTFKVNHVSIKIIFIFLIGLSLSCTKNYADYNTNPYVPTLDQQNADNFITGKSFTDMMNAIIPAADVGSQTDFSNSYQISNNLAGDVFSGFMGQAGDWGGNTNNLTYGFNLDWVNEQFKLNGMLMAAWVKIKSTTDLNKDSLQFSVAQLIKITGVSRTTDTYGPVPYSSLPTGTFTPAYDGQDKIYYSFFPELDKAINILYTLGVKAGKPLAAYDKIYGGDYLLWAKYGNSLKLRLAMRMAYVDPVNAKKYAEEAVNSPVGFLTQKSDGALQGKVVTASPYKNPLVTLTVNYAEARMGATMQSILSGYKDPRIGIYFNLSTVTGKTTEYVGVRTGINVTRSLYQPFSTLKVADNTPMPWMQASEVYFLLAEGAIRGWNMGGTAQNFYESGIKVAFDESGATIPSTYLADNTSKPVNYVDPANPSNNAVSDIAASTTLTSTIKWNEGVTFEDKLQRIITQKWIALYPNGQEAWTEFRRTGYPKIFPIVLNRSNGTVNSATQVRRLPYPAKQYLDNGTQIAKGLTLLGGADNGATKLWWDKK